MNDTQWVRDDVQIPRLLAEIAAVGLTPEQIGELCSSMDVSPEEIANILERADETWDAIKMQIDCVPTTCVFCGGKVQEDER